MSIFGGIKNRIFGKQDDFSDIGDIRSHVIGENSSEPYGDDETPPFRSQQYSVPELPDVTGGRGPSGFDMPETTKSEPSGGSDISRDYELLDRLKIMEAQLSAIRSQTETINERLKNIEMRLVRRY